MLLLVLLLYYLLLVCFLLLYGFAVLCGILHGCAFPLFSYVFGDTLADLGNPTSDSVVQVVSTQCLYMVYIGIASLLFSWSWHSIFTATSSIQATRIRIRYFEAVLSQDVSWFDGISPAELPTRMTEDVTKVQQALGFRVGLCIMNISMFISGLAIGFIRGWQVCLVMLAAMPVVILSSAMMGVALTKSSKISQTSYAKAGACAEEALSCIKTVTAFGTQSKELDRYNSALAEARKGGIKGGLYTGISLGITFGAVYGTYALTFWYGGTLVEDGTINTWTGLPYNGGDILTVFFSVLFATFGLGQAMPPIQVFQIGMASANDIYDVIDNIKPNIETPILPNKHDQQEQLISQHTNIQTIIKQFNTLTFTGVSFCYPSRPDVMVLDNISFTIKRGMKVAFVGESGSGKSTVLALLERFYDPNRGMVTLNDIDYRNINNGNPSSIRCLFGYVGQEPILFATSIRNNLTYGINNDNMPTDKEIKEACERANVHKFISSLPNGYDTYCGSSNGNSQISGGQKQRIAIARALLRNPQILLLDEATSALDNESEKMVQSTIDRTSQLRTTISIAHRLSTVRNSDIIYVMKHGKIVEYGKHNYLISKSNGEYYSLVSAQDAATDDDYDDDVNCCSKSSNINNNHHHHYHSRVVDGTANVPLMVKSCSINNEVKRPDMKTANITRFTSSSMYDDADDAAEKLRVERISKTYKVPWIRLLSLSKPESIYYIPSIIGSVLSGLAMPLEALLLSKALGYLFQPDTSTLMNGIVATSLGFLGVAIGVTIGNILQFWGFAYIGEHLTSRVRSMCYEKILRLEIPYFDEPEHAPGRLTATLGTYALKLNVLTGTQLGIFAQLTSTAVGGIIVSFSASPKLAAVMLATLPLVALSGAIDMMISGDGIGSSNKEDSYGQANQIISESVQNLRTLRALTAEIRTRDLFQMLIMKSVKKESKEAVISGFVYGLSSLITLSALALGFWYGATLIDNDGLSFDKMMQSLMGVFLSAMGVGQALAFMKDIKEARTAAHDIFQLLDYESKCDPLSNIEGRMNSLLLSSNNNNKPDNNSNEKSNISISFNNVSFTYPNRPQVPILNNLTINIPAGKTIALVGPSGGGKSTVFSLLQRFYDVDNGSISVEGCNINDINISWWRSQCGLVSQEPVLFNLTLEDNVRYGSPSDIPREVMIDVANKAGMSDFAGNKVHWDAPLGPRGGLLSGGQKQRVAIARALIRHPKLIMLDEATSALDSASETIVQKAIDDLTSSTSTTNDKPTSIIIAHRLSTIKKADKIIVISEGRAVEEGNHDELLAKRGVYYNLYTTAQQ